MTERGKGEKPEQTAEDSGAEEAVIIGPGAMRTERRIGKIGKSRPVPSFLEEDNRYEDRYVEDEAQYEAERETPVQMDDAYYDEVRKAVGRGTPSVLLGTSTRALERNLSELRRERRGHGDQESSPGITGSSKLTGMGFWSGYGVCSLGGCGA